MAGGMESGSITSTAVYRQDNEPDDKRKGLIWADTSGSGVTTKVYDGSGWASIVPNFPIFVTDETLSFNETGTDLSTTDVGIFSGALELAPFNTPVSRPEDNDTLTGDRSDDWGIAFSPTVDAVSVEVAVSGNSSGVGNVKLTDPSGTVISEKSGLNASAGDKIRFSDLSLTAGSEYAIWADGSASSYTAGYSNTTYSVPISGDGVDYIGDWNDGTLSKTDDGWVFNDVSVRPDNVTSGNATVAWSDIPTDLAAWDRVSWQSDDGGGSVTATVETNDGTGWSSFASDVASPYSIASVPTDHDVRVRFDLSRPTADDTSPLISYVARRGER